MNAKPSSWPLIVIALGLAGAGISYHFTLNARFAALEQKLDQNTVALQQYQASQDSAVTAKTLALDKLAKEVDTLQASLGPLGKANKDQTNSLAEIRHQISSLSQLQQAQQDAAKKLDDYAGQLEKIKKDVQSRDAQASSGAGLIGPVPPSVPLPTTAPVSVPIQAPPAPASAPTTHASVENAKPPVAPHTQASTVDLRPADVVPPRYDAVRALPVALPVDASLSDNR